MPKLSAKTNRLSLGGNPESFLVEVFLEGFVDAANFQVFERSLEEASKLAGRFLVVDFSEVHYINSSGISALIRQHEEYRRKGGLVCLAAVSRPVGLSMHLLGVTSLMPFCKDMETAREYVRDFLAGRVEGMPFIERATGDKKRQKSIAFRRQKKRRAGKFPVMVICPFESRFTRVLRRRFKHLNGDYHLLHDIQDALERYDQIHPDLVVLDDRCDPKGEFVSRLKVQKEKSLTSVIKLYRKETDVQGAVDFKIWENDFLVDPFEVLEFFSLTEAELDRVPKDRRVFHQQVHFEFLTRPDNIDKANRLCELIVRSALAGDEDRIALNAAVKEGLDNAVVHGNASSETKMIDVNFLVDYRKVTVLIEDEGAGFDFEYYLAKVSGKEAFDEAKKKILEEGLRGGLGILLMSKCADRIEYHGVGNTLRLEKNL